MKVTFSLEGKTATIEKDFTLAGVTVPKGFKSDGISSPKWSWFRYHPFSQWCPAAFVHDYCIETFAYPYARDKLIQALFQLDSSKFDVLAIYNAVRLKDWQRRTFSRLKSEY